MALESLRCPGLEKTLNVFPEILSCPICGHDIEIWTDEKKGKCTSCNRMIDPRAGNGNTNKAGDNNFLIAVKEFENEAGEQLFYERYEAVISIADFDFNKKYKIACEACHKYGKNFACPPYSPYFQDYLGNQNAAKVICIRMPQEYFRNEIQEKIYKKCFRTARGILLKELFDYKSQGNLVAGSGFCLGCDVCAVENGADCCQQPERKIYSLESLGVNLTSLTKRCFRFDLEWSATDHASDFVCSLGAVFMHYSDLSCTA